MCRPAVSTRSTTLNRSPSKRASPPNVPTQMYPSGVCSMALTEFCGNPSTVVHWSSVNSGGEVNGRLTCAAPDCRAPRLARATKRTKRAAYIGQAYALCHRCGRTPDWNAVCRRSQARHGSRKVGIVAGLGIKASRPQRSHERLIAQELHDTLLKGGTGI